MKNLPGQLSSRWFDHIIIIQPGTVDHPEVRDNGNGSASVIYQPSEEGPHVLDIKQDGDHVQGSPYKFHASPLGDGKVHAYGGGLTHAVCGDPANFVISTKGAGAGGLSLAVEGPSKAEIECLDNKDGTVNVSFLPTGQHAWTLQMSHSKSIDPMIVVRMMHDIPTCDQLLPKLRTNNFFP